MMNHTMFYRLENNSTQVYNKKKEEEDCFLNIFNQDFRWKQNWINSSNLLLTDDNGSSNHGDH